MKSIVTPKCVRTTISGSVRELRKADRHPDITVPSDGKGCTLNVTRFGMTESYPISRRVAEELIATGSFSIGD